MAFTLEHNKAPGRAPEGKGLVCLLTMCEWAEELIDEDDDTVLAKTTAAAEKLMPGFSDDIDFAQINRWQECIVYSRPGLYRELGSFNPGLGHENTRIKFGGACSPHRTCAPPPPRVSEPPARSSAPGAQHRDAVPLAS